QSRVIAVIGLGYLGLPVANGAARSSFKTVRFDIDKERVAELRAGHDNTREVEDADLRFASIIYTTDPAEMSVANFLLSRCRRP
ncbi:MAG TPA: nucleotide sugar dehydrogenase, partial [Methylocystis sp.]